MAQVVRYVDPDAVGGGTGLDWANAYTSLSLWDAGENTNLVTDNDYHTVHLRSSGGTADTTTCDLTGWTTDATHYIEIIQDDAPATGVYDNTAYRMEGTDKNILLIYESFVRVKGLQIQATQTALGTVRGIYILAIAAGACDIRIQNVIVKGACSGTGGAYGIDINSANADVSIYNSIFYDLVSGAGAGYHGVMLNSGALDVYNSTIYNCYYGMRRVNGTATATNCAVGNNTDDFFGTITVDYCCSDDGDGTNVQAPSGADWSNEFTDAANGDFDLVSGGNCIGNGTDDPGSGLYSDDIVGTARNSTWDISAFEFGLVAPDKAANPSPADSATDILLTTNLTWDVAANATSYDVYFGTDQTAVTNRDAAVDIGNQAGTTYDPPTDLVLATTYYWAIDSVGAGGTTAGDVWSFTTGSAPGQVSVPSPADGAVSVARIGTSLSWTAGSGATSYNVYFGTDELDIASRGNQAGVTYALGNLSNGTVYYWRIDSVNAFATTTGPAWSFTSAATAAQVDAHYVDADIMPGITLEWTDSRSQARDLYFPGSHSHLEAETVQVLGDGAYLGTEAVSSGSVALDDDTTINHIGLAFDSTLKPMKIDLERMGIALTKKIVDAIISFYNTLGGQYGNTTSNLYPIILRDRDDAFGSPPSLHTGIKELPYDTDYERDGNIIIIQDEPNPMTVRGIILPVGAYNG
jgi:hypothetical protein